MSIVVWFGGSGASSTTSICLPFITITVSLPTYDTFRSAFERKAARSGEAIAGDSVDDLAKGAIATEALQVGDETYLLLTGVRELAAVPTPEPQAPVGPPLVDLACLVAGRWSADQRADMADAYYRELAREGGDVPRREHYLRTLNACLLHVAVQNLGWSAEWIPPKDHTHDWLGDALELSEEWR